MDHNHAQKKPTTNEIIITITTATAIAPTKLFRWVNIFILKVTVQKTPHCRNSFLKMVDIGFKCFTLHTNRFVFCFFFHCQSKWMLWYPGMYLPTCVALSSKIK